MQGLFLCQYLSLIRFASRFIDDSLALQLEMH